MNKKITFYPAVPADGAQDFSITLPVHPICPLCHTGNDPIIIDGFYHILPSYQGARIITAHAICLCSVCERFFVMPYAGQEVSSLFPQAPFPGHAEQPLFDKSIKQLSPAFCEIFSQAAEAEAQGLSDICGLGYRKALEFLVKDYVKHLHPEDGDPIESEPLSATIKRIDDRRIKTLAQRAAWLGNDETHYVRHHLDRDVSDMKTFIDAMLHFIASELSFEDALSISPK